MNTIIKYEHCTGRGHSLLGGTFGRKKASEKISNKAVRKQIFASGHKKNTTERDRERFHMGRGFAVREICHKRRRKSTRYFINIRHL